ncbi:MAG: type II toxin-antitoxin system RelE/ParE family toxin [Syntrophomonadaceae bacterium]|nr:type II toxin-antitoxin system RelE/ParE family toxin [Syntrophomonadaceae bacterium]
MKIIWTEPALLDAESIKTYIEQDSEIYAIRVIEKIIETLEDLKLYPKMGRVVPEFRKKDIREIFVYNYRIIYELQGQSITVLTIIHSARDLGSVNR